MSNPSPTLQPSRQERLVSLDALRGFDMFWIIFGEALVHILHEKFHWGPLEWLHTELQHPEWHGFTFYDLIFPLFMFLAGVSFSYSLNKRRQQGTSNAQLHWQIIKRGLLLVLLGCIYNGLLLFDFENQRYPSVLGRIGLGYMGGALIALHLQTKGRLIVAAALLLGYWILMKYVPVPGFGTGVDNPGETWSGYLDRIIVSGHLYKDVRDPEGLVSTIPSIVNVLAGVITGDWLRREDKSGYQKVGAMALAGILCWGAGQLWNFDFPINKNLWTSSFVLVTVGWSLIFLATFYLVIDVWKLRWWTLFFVVIGVNPLFIYLASAFIDFNAIAALILRNEEGRLHPTLIAGTGLILKWLVLYVMYRKKIFLRL
ncbi:hypothetical protein Pla110_03950 [Polystyrenella longa]|uniref:Heparan-alpha-glucosaminide N-acetyltransferase catalytic domain-containing protein n=1 Tax=Polystyrenella longa TaxID=2528007 RepID=A0A518CHJ5_9PLAN|nr:DUF5009 domain-containing protein [Polystyrenella longa]QDU78691.1 hypothetical protein Pla110_03950 [Polystyrenella longa]